MAMQGRVLTKFPANVVATDGVVVTKENGTYAFSLEPGLSDIAALTGEGIVRREADGSLLASAGVAPSEIGAIAAQTLVGNPTGASGNAAEIPIGGGLAFSGSTLLATVAWSNTRLAKTANYTVTNADKSKTLALGGSAFFTLTLGAASGYDADFAIVVVNEDSGRAKRISPNGLTSFLLWPKQAARIFNQNNVWTVDPSQQRFRPPAGVTLNVDPVNGVDTNDGMSTGAGGAVLTIQQAVNYVIQGFDIGLSGAITIQLAAGTYSAGAVITGPPIGSTTWLTIVGDETTPGNCIINIPASDSGFFIQDFAGVNLRGMRLQAASGNVTAIRSKAFALIDLRTLEFGSCGANGIHMSFDESSVVSAVGNYAITGGALAHLNVTNNAVFDLSSNTVTIGSAVAFTYFAIASGNSIITGVSPTFTGAGVAGTTGVKALVSNSAYINTGISWPGSSAIQGFYMGGADGTASLPFYNWEQDSDTGLYRGGANNPAMSAGGTKCADFKASGTAILGTNTNDSAAAGWVGERVYAELTSGSATSLSDTVAKNITSISLPAGDWDVAAVVHFIPANTTTVTLLTCSVSTTSATLDTTPSRLATLGISYTSGGNVASVQNPTTQFSLSATTTVYLVGRATFGTSTCTAYGRIEARRVR